MRSQTIFYDSPQLPFLMIGVHSEFLCAGFVLSIIICLILTLISNLLVAIIIFASAITIIIIYGNVFAKSKPHFFNYYFQSKKFWGNKKTIIIQYINVHGNFKGARL